MIILNILIGLAIEALVNAFGLNQPAPTPTPAPLSVMETKATPTPSITPLPKKTVTQTSSNNNINCVGPDGKTFKTTEVECKKFNDAWGIKTTAGTKMTNGTNLVACTLDYGSYKKTYNFSPEECKKAQDYVSSTYGQGKTTQPGTSTLPTSVTTPTTTLNQQTPVPTQTPNQNTIAQCQDRCRSIGASGEKRITEQAQIYGTIGTGFYTDQIAANNEWIRTCISNCH